MTTTHRATHTRSRTLVLVAAGVLCAPFAFAQPPAQPPAEPPPAPPAVETKPAETPPATEKPAATKPESDGKNIDGKTAQNNVLADEITPELDLAVKKGLAWLASQQNADGSFGGGRYGKNVAISALAGLAFMADGHLPGRGAYGEHVRRCIDYTLASATETGLITADANNGPMYGHGFATLFLGEVYGMTAGGGDTRLAERVHEALLKACRLIERTQNDEGGWRYNPVPYDADVSVTICEVMALRSARNAGVEVPKATIDKAVEYVKKCQNPDGGFRYQADMGMSAWPRSAAGVATLFYAGVHKDEAIEKGVDYIKRVAHPDNGVRQEMHYFYGQYYSVQSMYLAGGKHWANWWPAIRKELIDRQTAAGSWQDPTTGPVYGTSMALIVLQMPKRYLPIFQR
ncbi:MAG: prenyltransferase/squalene oxidase repeat-containing protein [Phycisphaerales bacterium]